LAEQSAADDVGDKSKPTLVELASKPFPDLFRAEQELLHELEFLHEAPLGELANCKDQVMRGKLIRWLCIESDAQSRIDPQGIRIQSAVRDELDLSFMIVRFPWSSGLAHSPSLCCCNRIFNCSTYVAVLLIQWSVFMLPELTVTWIAGVRASRMRKASRSMPV